MVRTSFGPSRCHLLEIEQIEGWGEKHEFRETCTIVVLP